MYDDKDMCTCGHSRWDHSYDPKGFYGNCMTQIIEDWEWCKCEQFVSRENTESEHEKPVS